MEKTEQAVRIPKHHAILIGVDSHPVRPLKGSVNDIVGIKTILEAQPYSVYIKTLIAPIDGSDHAGLIESLGNQACLPTSRNVEAAMTQTTEDAAPGDYVYIHFSGHGSYYVPSAMPAGELALENLSNRFTGDLALALVDQDLRGQRFALMINAMVVKGLVVTLVLDCCSSGAFSRDEEEEEMSLSPDIRFAPPRPPPDASEQSTEVGGRLMRSLLSRYRQVSLRPSWLMDPKGYTALVACGPREFAPEVKVGGKHFGKLSHLLSFILGKTGPNRRCKVIYRQLRRLYWNARQTPVVYGNKEQFFFGPLPNRSHLAEEDIDTDVTIPVVKVNAERYRLMVGEAHGFCVGDEVSMCREQRQGVASQGDQVVLATLVSIDAVTAIVVLDEPPPPLIPSFTFAIPRTRTRLREFPVCISSDLNDIPRWQQALADRSLVSVNSMDEGGVFRVLRDLHSRPPRFKITHCADEGEEEDALWLPPMLEDDTEPEDVADILVHLAKYRLVKRLTNQTQTTDNESFASSIKAGVVTLNGIRYNPDELVKIQECRDRRWTFEISVQNDGKQPVHMCIYVLGPQWEIVHVHDATLEVVTPARDQEPGFTPGLTRRLRTTVPEGMRRGVSGAPDVYTKDLIKVFVTSHPTTFDILEQSEVWKVDKKSRQRGTTELDDRMEKWAVFDFPIQTTLALPAPVAP